MAFGRRRNRSVPMVAAGTAGAGRFLQPDRVLDQCDAQFRMVSYHTCEVPPEILYGDGCGALADTGQFNTMRTWVNDHCDVPDDVPRVIFLGSLGAGSCPGGVTKGSQHHGDVAISYLFADKKTLPHELGHLLGLGHVTDSNNLMIPCKDQAECPPQTGCAHGFCLPVCADTDDDCNGFPTFTCQHPVDGANTLCENDT